MKAKTRTDDTACSSATSVTSGQRVALMAFTEVISANVDNNAATVQEE
jgi:hypothetical protein